MAAREAEWAGSARMLVCRTMKAGASQPRDVGCSLQEEWSGGYWAHCPITSCWLSECKPIMMAKLRVSNCPRGLYWWCSSQKALLVESILAAKEAPNVSPLELVSACLTILGTNFIALLRIQWHSLVAPNTDPSHANRNTPTGMIFKMSTPLLRVHLQSWLIITT